MPRLPVPLRLPAPLLLPLALAPLALVTLAPPAAALATPARPAQASPADRPRPFSEELEWAVRGALRAVIAQRAGGTRAGSEGSTASTFSRAVGPLRGDAGLQLQPLSAPRLRQLEVADELTFTQEATLADGLLSRALSRHRHWFDAPPHSRLQPAEVHSWLREAAQRYEVALEQAPQEHPLRPHWTLRHLLASWITGDRVTYSSFTALEALDRSVPIDSAVGMTTRVLLGFRDTCHQQWRNARHVRAGLLPPLEHPLALQARFLSIKALGQVGGGEITFAHDAIDLLAELEARPARPAEALPPERLEEARATVVRMIGDFPADEVVSLVERRCGTGPGARSCRQDLLDGIEQQFYPPELFPELRRRVLE